MKTLKFNARYIDVKAIIMNAKTQTRRLMSDEEIKQAITYMNEKLRENSKYYTERDKLFNYYFCEKPKKKRYQRGDIVKLKIIQDKNIKIETISEEEHYLKIKSISIKKIQEISTTECMKEGVVFNEEKTYPYGLYHAILPDKFSFRYSTPHEAFKKLIDNIYTRGTYQSNAYVWVIEFECMW